MSDDFIREQIAQFKWFVHTDFGNGIVARSTSWPQASLNSRHMGVSKFEFVVRRNLPDLKGKRVLEMGCNNGVVALHMSKLGAAEVVALDSEKYWPRWREQAAFVKEALEWRHQAHYNVRFEECDMRDVPSRDFGRFDCVIALNCIYYLLQPEIKNLVNHLSTTTEVLLVQGNTCRGDHNPEIKARSNPKFLSRVMKDHGFPRVKVDWPWDYPRRGFWPQKYCRPVIVGSHSAP